MFLIFVSTSAIADGKNQHFHHETYDHALKSENLGKAAKCEVLSSMLDYKDPKKFFTEAAVEVSLSNGKIYPSNEFLEIKLAYNALKNFHYGRLSVLEEINKTNEKSEFNAMYKNVGCDNLIQ